MTGKGYEQPSGHVRVESDLFQITDIGRIQVSIWLSAHESTRGLHRLLLKRIRYARKSRVQCSADAANGHDNYDRNATRD